jgi:hypothetical protein
MIAGNNMVKRSIFLVVTLLIFPLLSACNSTVAPTETSLSEIYTEVAVTLAAVNVHATTPTNIPLPTHTLIPLPTLTLAPAAPVAPTNKAVVPVAQSNVGSCDNSAFVNDVTIPDGTILAPSQTLVKTWLLQNTGSCTWSSSYQVIYVSGSQMAGTATAIGQTVASGKQLQVSVTLTAPSTEDTYTGYWKLANESGSVFGASFYVKIVVSSDAATLTPTITPTADTSTPTTTATVTSTPTDTTTVENTATTAPTSTPLVTSTPLPTSTPVVTNTPIPASTATCTVQPTSKATSTPKPTEKPTRTPTS